VAAAWAAATTAAMALRAATAALRNSKGGCIRHRRCRKMA
jgi:hypothetical protein